MHLKQLHIFHTFAFCTVHLFWSKNGNTELQQRFITFLTLSQLQNVPILQTKHEKYNFSINKFKMFPTTSQVDLHCISRVYYRVFLMSKFSTYCVLQLPALNNIGNHDIEDYFRNDLIYRSNLRLNETLYTADYIVLPVASDTTSLLTFHVSYYELYSKVILYNIMKNIKFIPCTPSINDCWINKKLLWVESKENITLGKNNLWIDIITQTQSPMTIWETETADWNPEKLCPYTGKKLRYNLSLITTATEKCVKLMIAASINCTSESCQKILKTFYQYALMETPVGWQSIQHYSPSGIQFHGYRYSVFVNRKSNYQEFIASKLIGPLLLCGVSELAIGLVTVFCLAVMLNKTGFPGNPFYWIYATLLEQEVCKFTRVNYKNWGCLILWLYTCHLFRMQYASNIYASMTKESDPSGVSNTFHQLLNNTNIMLLSNSKACYRFLTTKDKESYKNNLRKYYLERINNKTVWYLNNLQNILTLAYSGPENTERFSCEKSGVIFLVGKENAEKHYKGIRYKNNKSFEQMCTNWNRFAWLYNTNAESNTGYKFENTLYSKLLLLMFGDYILKENSDPVMFPELHQWFSRKRTYLSVAFDRKIGSLTESGLNDYQNHFLEIITQRTALEYFLEGSQYNRSWNWLSMINQIVSKHTPLAWYSAKNGRLADSFKEMQQITKFGLRIENFWYCFLSYGVTMIIIVLIFLFEIRFFKI